MKKRSKLKIILTVICSVFLLLSAATCQSASAATSKDKLSEPISGKIKNKPVSINFDVIYPTDFDLAVFVGNTLAENKENANQYKVSILNWKNNIKATSSMSSFYEEKSKNTFYYQTIETRLDPGHYTLKISLNKDASLAKTQIYNIYTDREIRGGIVSSVSLKTKLKSPQPLKKTIGLNAKAKGEYLKYRFTVIDNHKKRTVIRNFSSKNTANWKPKKVGTYKVEVLVKNIVSGKTASKTITYKIKK
ncbi:hypothetical protein M3603_15285 [Rummeliibacillus stabekisii]|uniref:hypothetical protein n=1 Tax=Rummeliibacillus stabekisii TaxID=241244 RepID=UPI00203B426D|nr:hypothetical protein [Rummeliibacillus stabekisii]MCM3317981.1 hypothetical protein [Rummeliibacillus stabekisii]